MPEDVSAVDHQRSGVRVAADASPAVPVPTCRSRWRRHRRSSGRRDLLLLDDGCGLSDATHGRSPLFSSSSDAHCGAAVHGSSRRPARGLRAVPRFDVSEPGAAAWARCRSRLASPTRAGWLRVARYGRSSSLVLASLEPHRTAPDRVARKATRHRLSTPRHALHSVMVREDPTAAAARASQPPSGSRPRAPALMLAVLRPPRPPRRAVVALAMQPFSFYATLVTGPSRLARRSPCSASAARC